jgi:hypothetical protein
MEDIDIFNFDYDDLMETNKTDALNIEKQESNQNLKGKKINNKKSKSKQ